MSEDVFGPARGDELRTPLQALLEGHGRWTVEGVPVPTLEELLNDARVDLADRFAPTRSEVTISWDDVDLREVDLLIRAFQKAAAKFLSAETLGPAVMPGTPTSARASVRGITRRPPVHLVVLALIWLILVVGPVAGEKLPSEIQTMLSTEVGTVALGLAITQIVNDRRK